MVQAPQLGTQGQSRPMYQLHWHSHPWKLHSMVCITVFPHLKDSSSLLPPLYTSIFSAVSTFPFNPFFRAISTCINLSSVLITYEVSFLQMPTAFCVLVASLILSYSPDICDLILVFLLDCVILEIRGFILLFFFLYLTCILYSFICSFIQCIVFLSWGPNHDHSALEAFLEFKVLLTLFHMWECMLLSHFSSVEPWNKGAEQLFSKNASLSFQIVWLWWLKWLYINSVNQLFENSSD